MCDRELSCAGQGPRKDKVDRMKNVEYAAVALSSDDELTHSLSMESCNGESKDLMEAVKEGRRAQSPANESDEDRRRESERERLVKRGLGQQKTQDKNTICSAEQHGNIWIP